MPRDQSPMDDSNNHYMKLISPSNNKTLVTPEKRQNYDIMAFEDTWRGEQRRDRETGRRPEERKKKERERNGKRKRKNVSRRGQEREMRGDREQRARVIGQRRAPLSSSAMRPPARRAAECGGVRRGTTARTLRGVTNGKCGAVWRGATRSNVCIPLSV